MFKAGFVQFQPFRHDVQRNIDNLKTLTRTVKADLLVLPELANSGYMYRSSDALAPYSESADGSGPFLSALQEISCETGAVLVAGLLKTPKVCCTTPLQRLAPAVSCRCTARRTCSLTRRTCLNRATAASMYSKYRA